MKYIRRCFCLLLCSVLLLGVFSVNAKAYDYFTDYSVRSVYRFTTDNDEKAYSFLFNPTDGVAQSYEWKNTYYTAGETQLYASYHVYSNSGKYLAEAEKETTITLQGVYYSWFFEPNSPIDAFSPFYNREKPTVYARVYYSDKSWKRFEDVEITYDSGAIVDFSFKITPDKDIASILFIIENTVNYEDKADYIDITGYLGEINTSATYSLVVDQEEEETKLLKGITGWIKNIFNSITGGFADMVSGLGNVVNSIIELPAKLWSSIENGLKALFVPSESYITSFKEKCEELLADRLGALYEVVDITLDSWDRIMDADGDPIIELPEVSINLPGDASFTFGGDVVQVVPQGFDFLATSVKTVVGILATIAFVNGLRKRYDNIMGGNA